MISLVPLGYVEKQFNVLVKSIRSDNAKEFGEGGALQFYLHRVFHIKQVVLIHLSKMV